MAVQEQIQECADRLRKELHSVVSFWTAHSHDEVNGGYYNCLTKDGKVFDTLKYGWLQGRQVWMYSKLYNTLSHYHTTEMLAAARAGGEFLMKHVLSSDSSRCYFIVTETGKPCRLQRKPYTECFYVMGLAELSRATGENKYWVAAEAMLTSFIRWVRYDDSELGAVCLPGCEASSELGRPMMLLNVLTEFCGNVTELRDKYKDHFQWAINAILKHSDGHWVRENIAPDGSLLSGCCGRQVTPGHALEAGWFLLTEAATRGDATLREKAIKQFIEAPYEYGLDTEHGGIYYFLDSEGYCPTQLEWSMKLWWVHCEAMIAFLSAYQASGAEQYWRTFLNIAEYTLSKFSDPTDGEWFGYLTREGKVNQSFKGGPYKGCFHVPRCLLYCVQILEKLSNKTK